MYFVIFQGEDSRYAVMHLVQTFCDVYHVCRNKIFKIEIERNPFSEEKNLPKMMMMKNEHKIEKLSKINSPKILKEPMKSDIFWWIPPPLLKLFH